MRVLELFGGIGACSAALRRIGVPVEIVDYVEIDKFAVKSYNAINGTSFEPQDITEWDKDIQIDLLMHGSPCQDFSLAGLQKGGDEGSGTRSSLMYETLRIVKKLKPKYVVWENVKNLLGKAHIHNFNNYLKVMELLGYTNYYRVLNAADYSIPQKRERVFTVSILNGEKDFVFPDKVLNCKKPIDLLEHNVDEKFYLSDAKITALQTTSFGTKGKQISYDGLVPTLTAGMGMGGGNVHFVEDLDTHRLRKLTPLECWRFMGFSDEDFYKAQAVNSNTQLYKQAGNSIVVNVLAEIFKSLFGL